MLHDSQRTRLNYSTFSYQKCQSSQRYGQLCKQVFISSNETDSSRITKESVIEIEGTVQIAKDRIESCTIHNVEVIVQKILVISEAARLPFQIEDATRTKAELEHIASELSALQEALGKISKHISNRKLPIHKTKNSKINWKN